MQELENLNLNIILKNELPDIKFTEFESVLKTKIINIYNVVKGSNNNLLIEFVNNDFAIFKPKLGERTLNDFPIGTLYKREYASYILSLILGWPNIPPTSIVEIDNIGIGSIQKIINNKGLNYFEIIKNNKNEFMKFAIFDSLTNNADRKGGHCIIDDTDTIWSIDHGVTFHEIFKLRTVMFDIWEDKISNDYIKDIKLLKKKLSEKKYNNIFLTLLTEKEFEALNMRIDTLIKSKSLPSINQYENIPWPLI